jgi:double-stranded RNA-binding protein Staufen
LILFTETGILKYFVNRHPFHFSDVVTTVKPAASPKTNGETTKPTTDQPSKPATAPTPAASKPADGIRPKDQLLYLASVVGFTVHFSDFPKGNHGEYLTIVTLTTEPQQYCHGAGNSTEASHDQAAATALTLLTQLGLDNVVPKKSADE